MSDIFPGHVAGQPYELTRGQFCRFANLPNVEGPELWAAIASFEARRRFDPFSSLCHSELFMDTSDNSGAMRWWYRTTSETEFEIIEHREFGTEPAPGYPGQKCSNEVPAPSYRVTIPAERDQPDRYHWRQIREGGSYCS
jgi:hypothetical protein